ncbi:methyl-accepting chemotaxis protein [Vibrio sp. Of7-15]|uniref:methyl-accepting chemotaxis protein n=1 Tax=Vibrio sp. Of7-15 TaxID=2724879 RepID=UPI001EF2F514|nr:methyl-accepting chemotaxis protein [Vibrio sp. Of7-15]MCG7499531.1 methyl-accepting chemotaxis protein [Vibrio sp. Of7-15]
MSTVNVSQKQKLTAAVVVLLFGFAILGGYTAISLSHMSEQMIQSNRLSSAVATLKSTEVQLLKLAGSLNDMDVSKIPKAKSDLKEVQNSVKNNQQSLINFDLPSEATKLEQALSGYIKAFNPWLELRSELGFNVEDGKLGELKTLASTIEAKIKETGMVTLDSDFQNMIKMQQNYLLLPTEKNKKLFNRALGAFVSMSNVYAMLDLYEKEIEQFKVTFVRVSELSQQLGQLEDRLFNSQENVLSTIDNVDLKLEAMAELYQDQSSDAASTTLVSTTVACFILAAITLSIFMTLSISITRALTRTTGVLEAMSSGNLSQRLSITDNDKDEFNRLAIAINQTCENLGQLVSKVQQSSGDLSKNATELNQTVDYLVNSQSEVVEQTQVLASATEEVSVTTQEVSNSLSMVAEVSKESSRSAEDGGEVITSAITSLEDVGKILTAAATHIQQLEEASSKVDSVMEIINGIAEQTNLLALNAAIEAARAGEQGRGFAVVADEVRNLAVRTVTAVGEISGTIDTMKKESAEVIQYISQSEESMELGLKRGHEAMNAIKGIIQKADEANHQTELIFESIKELAVTSHSMADSMTQISAAMKDSDDNNTLLRENSKAVGDRSHNLNEDCKQFSV